MKHLLEATAGTALAALALAGCSGAAPVTHSAAGQVNLGPACPVERAGEPCELGPAALSGVTVTATGKPGTRTAVVAPDGSYILWLENGTWTVTADAGMSCQQQTIQIENQEATGITIECDTGIR